MSQLTLALAQLNFTVGDLAANVTKHLHAIKEAREHLHADVIIFPELSLTGYIPEDLLLRKHFLHACDAALKKIAAESRNIYCIIGHPLLRDDKLYNACSVFYNQQCIAQYCKVHLPNYGVFDECRYFTPGQHSCVFKIKDLNVGIIICEDMWYKDPLQNCVAAGADLILIPNASPFEVDKHERRLSAMQKRIAEVKKPLVYVNLVGGQDELTFDGGSLVMDAQGGLCQFVDFFQEKIHVCVLNCANQSVNIPKQTIKAYSNDQRIYQSLVLSLRDYVEKNHFSGVLLGISGGIDSALTACIAVDALGAERVQGVIMPSRFTSKESMRDARALIKNLKIAHEEISIEPSYAAFLQSLQPIFKNSQPDLTEENIQARCRAIILMALSNKYGKLVLSTGNRSELAVGYCTLYGDMAGGFALIKDVLKTQVYQLARYRNSLSQVIPEYVLTRAPTAELAQHQTDQDTLPPYDILDKIIYLSINQRMSVAEIIAQGFKPEIVEKVLKLIRLNEYKRRQAAIGPRINLSAFGKDRRYPITNGFKGNSRN
jgi:NAD+ synthase (glutamine-hydrolysing)